jgi:hypothetical protein
MFGKKMLLAMAAGLALAAGAGVSRADTITVTDYHVGGIDVNDNPLQVSPGTYLYEYDVNFDSDTLIPAATTSPSDGFVVYDFADYVSSSLTTLDGAPPVAADFHLNLVSVGTGGFLQNGTALSKQLADAPYTDTTTPNLVFNYVGPKYTGSGNSDLLLKVYSHYADSGSAYASGVDNSGTKGGFSDSLQPVETAFVPLPSSYLSGAVLLGLLGVYRLRKAVIA